MGTSWFGPNDDCVAKIIERIDAAYDALYGLIATYQLGPIHDALIAKIPDLDEMILIFDRFNALPGKPFLLELQAAGAVVMIDRHERSIRSQYLITSPRWTVTGSYLWAPNFADDYASDLQIMDYNNEWTKHVTNFLYHQGHSELYTDPWPPD